MKKPHAYNVLSDVVCAARVGCSRRIKANVLERKTRASLLCYPCFRHDDRERRTRPAGT